MNIRLLSLIRRLLFAGLLLAPGPAATGPLARGAVVLGLAAGVVLRPAPAEARRFGGGRSFGFRGSRGLFRRSYRGFGARAGRSAYGRGYGGRRRGFGWGFPLFFGFPFFGFGFGLFRMILIPLILFFVLSALRSRRE